MSKKQIGKTMNVNTTILEKIKDHRGFLVQCLTNSELKNKQFGTIYVVYIAPKMVRGRHYHKTKQEQLWIASGRCKIVLLDVRTKEKAEFILDSSDDKVTRITIEPFVVHGIENLSDEVSIIIGYSDEPYNAKDPDKYSYDLKL